MSKVLEYTVKGVREIRRIGDKHTCLECKYLNATCRGVYACRVRDKSTLNDLKFPYDNTSCKEYEPNEEE